MAAGIIAVAMFAMCLTAVIVGTTFGDEPIFTRRTLLNGGGGMYYSGTPIADLSNPPPRLNAVFLNFDATISTSDEFSLRVLKKCGRTNATAGHGITAAQLTAAFRETAGATNATHFHATYFGGARRVESLRRGLDTLRTATGGKVHVLSASWAPVAAEVWAAYLLAGPLAYLDLGFDEQHVIGVTALGPPIVPKKGAALEKYMRERYGESPSNTVQVDKFKYATQMLGVGADIMCPDPTPVKEEDLQQLILRAGGSVPNPPPTAAAAATTKSTLRGGGGEGRGFRR
jgi:hypothetical protein